MQLIEKLGFIVLRLSLLNITQVDNCRLRRCPTRIPKSFEISPGEVSAVINIPTAPNLFTQRCSRSTLPAPIIGALCPVALSLRCAIVASVAAFQCAACLTAAEYEVAIATDAVALKVDLKNGVYHNV